MLRISHLSTRTTITIWVILHAYSKQPFFNRQLIMYQKIGDISSEDNQEKELKFSSKTFRSYTAARSL